MPLKKSSRSVSTILVYFHLSFQMYGHYGGGGGGGQVVNAQNYVFYFESVIANVFPFRPTCSSYDYERENRSKSEPKDKKRK